MNRLISTLSTLALLGAFCPALFRTPALAQQTSAPPNVIIIFADDLGWGDLGCYGNKVFKTPHIDRLAQEGARLTQFYATAPYCAPSRAALLTGRYQFRSGLTGNPTPDASPAADVIGLPAEEVTLGEVFQSAGYQTACIGKWHLGHKPQFYPTRHGFDEYLGILYSNDMRPVQLFDGESVVEYPVIQANLTKRYTARAIEFIERSKGKPFFLYLPHAMPHKPLAASEDFYKQTGAGLYGDVMAELDWSTGEIVAALRKLGLEENTLLIFSSDNGAWYGGDNGGLRGMKATTWEGGIRVPFIVRWPGRIPAGHVSHEMASLIDVLPTVLNAVKLPLPAGRVIDGKDILPLLTTDAKTPHQAIFSMAGARLNTVRSGKWKLHIGHPGSRGPMAPEEKWIDPRGPDGVTIIAPYEQAHPSEYPGLATGDAAREMMLFDLENDPGEQRDVAAQHPEIVERLKRLHEELNREVAAASAQTKRQ